MQLLKISQGYFQVSVNEKLRDYTGIITPDYRTYQFTSLPFGLSSAPSSFQLLLRSVIGDLENIIVAVYMDDLLFCSSTFEGLLQDMQIVFDRSITSGMTLQISKCVFAVKEVTYLGHIFGQITLRPNPDKVKVVADMKTPRIVKELRQSLGFMNHSKKFIEDYSKIGKPVY